MHRLRPGTGYIRSLKVNNVSLNSSQLAELNKNLEEKFKEYQKVKIKIPMGPGSKILGIDLEGVFDLLLDK